MSLQHYLHPAVTNNVLCEVQLHLYWYNKHTYMVLTVYCIDQILLLLLICSSFFFGYYIYEACMHVKIELDKEQRENLVQSYIE